MRDLKALLPRGRHGYGISLCEILMLFYHVADMVTGEPLRNLKALLPRGRHGGIFLLSDLNALLPCGRHGEDICLREISRIFYHVADMVRVFLYVRSQGSSNT
jgi:hypothetical protein